MRHVLALILIGISTSYSASGQDGVVPDTLDWRGYYPLEVGNVWEWYWYTIGESVLDRREIIGDTTLDGTPYFVQARYSSRWYYDVTTTKRDTVYVRYDPDSSRVMQIAGSGAEEWALTCDLSTPFGGRSVCRDGSFPEQDVFGGYPATNDQSYLLVGEDTVHFRAAKHFSNVAGGTTYYHGVGKLDSFGEGNIYGAIDFVYLRIGGRAYGSTRVTSRAEDLPVPPLRRMKVYPTPARSILTVEGEPGTRTVLVYDTMGRMVLSASCASARCSVDVSGLATGTYFAGYENGGEQGRAVPFVVLK